MAKPSRMSILVTHDLDDAARLGDRLLVLSERPARLRHVVPIATPRSEREDSEIAAIKAEIARLTNGDRASQDS